MDMDMLQKGQSYDQLSPLVLVFVCAFDLFNEGRYVYTFKSRCLENLDLELANDITTMFLNANGVAGDVAPQMVNFLEYVRTQVPNDEYTHELEAEVARLKQDKEVRRKYMVLQAELRDTQILAFEAGEAKGLAEGHAAGLAEGEAKGREAGLAEGEVNKFVAMVERKMKRRNMTCEEAMEDLDCTPEERQAYYDYVAKNK